MWQHLIHYHIQVSGLIARCENAGTYLIGGRREYKRIIRCCQCSRPRALFQEMSALPIERHAAAFQTHAFVSVDYAGPIVVWEDKKEVKKYVMIVSCMVSRHMHAEVVHRQTTYAFLNAFRAYAAIYGTPLRVFSDNMLAFTSGAKELKHILRNLDWSEIQAQTSEFDWIFSCPLASSKMGIIESMVKQFKTALEKALRFTAGTKQPPKRFDSDQFRIILLELCAVINDCPLARPIDDKQGTSDVIHVSPNHLIRGRRSKIIPYNMRLSKAVEDGMNVAIVHTHRARLMRAFWGEFLASYHRTLKFTPKFFEKMANDIPLGTMVLLKEKQLKPGHFATGVVVDVYRRPDTGVISRLQVKTTANKNPVWRDLRQCFMCKHDYMRLVNPAHSCLITDKEDRQVDVPISAHTLASILYEGQVPSTIRPTSPPVKAHSPLPSAIV